MNLTALLINGIALAGVVLSLAKDRKKTRQSLAVAGKSFLRILPMTLLIILAIGLLLGFVPPSRISQFLGEQSGAGGVLLAGAVGAVMHIPALLSFPLAASLLDSGASVTAVAAFITTLTMIGMITLPLEIRELGLTFAALRNGLSFLAALLIALLMGWIL
ncbi:MAG TPA: permease [Thermoplasmatales archaeon]|nr:permease [Thermoplasmatales archaeon]